MKVWMYDFRSSYYFFKHFGEHYTFNALKKNCGLYIYIYIFIVIYIYIELNKRVTLVVANVY